MSATVQLNDRQAIALDAIRGSADTTKGVLLTLEGSTPGEAMSDRHVLWALSGYRTELYDDAAAVHGWHRTDYQAMTRRGVVTESLWTNFDPAMVDLHDHRYLGDDYRERERVQRKVKRWVNKLKVLPRHERNAIMAALANIAVAGGAPSSSIARSGERARSGA